MAPAVTSRGLFHVIILLFMGVSALQAVDVQKTMFQTVKSFAQKYPEPTHKVVHMVTEKLLPRDLARQYETDITTALADTKETTECLVCRLLFRLVEIGLTFMTWEEMEPNIIYYCEFLFKAIDQTIRVNDLCHIVSIQGPHVAIVIDNPLVDANMFCEFLTACMNTTATSRAANIADRLPLGSLDSLLSRTLDAEGSLPLEARDTKPSLTSSRKAGIITVAQLTDIHIEPNYAEDSATKCGLYVCCLEKWGPGGAGGYGDYECNIPQKTMELFLNEVRRLAPNFVIYSGDTPPHTVWAETLESQLECTATLTRSLTNILPAGLRVYPSIGNHEMYPTNLYSNSYLANETGYMASQFFELWQPLAAFTAEQEATWSRAGFYSILAQPGLRIIDVNTNYMYNNNWYNLLQRGPVGEVADMKREIRTMLTRARAAAEKVIVVGHHVPGGGDYIIDEAHWYVNLMVEFSDIIVLQVAGHTHTDEFRLMWSAAGLPVSMLYVSPSVDAHGHRNPSIRLFHLDADTFQVLDYDQYYFDIKGITDDSIPPRIVKLYSAINEYGLADMSPDSWALMLRRFEADKALLTKHRSHRDANAYPTSAYTCDAECERIHVCRHRHAAYDDYRTCTASTMAGGQSQTQPNPPHLPRRSVQ